MLSLSKRRPYIARFALALASAFLAAAAPPADPFAGLPNVRFAYRPIAGTTVDELAAALEASAEHPPGGGSSYAHTRWSIRWRTSERGIGTACHVTAVEMLFDAVVTLPRLDDAAMLDDATAARWSAFRRAIALHEAGHARRAFAYLPRVRRAILTSPCATTGVTGRAMLHTLDAAQAAYDRATRNGATQGAHFP